MGRKQISTKTRFDVFKRDAFACQYCGKSTPAVILEIDHIHPIREGGSNHIDNLVTACFDCNRGKGGRELSQIPETFEIKAERMREKELQYSEFKKLQDKIEKRLASEIKLIGTLYCDYFPGYEMKDHFLLSSVRGFIEKLGFNEVAASLHKAVSKTEHRDQSIKYFCGICWNKIKNGVDYSPFK